MSRMNLNETSNSKRLFAANTVDQTLKSPTLTADQRYDSEASLVSIGSTMSVMEQPHSLAVLGNITQVGTIIIFLTLLVAKWVDMKAKKVKITRFSYAFLTLWLRPDKSVVTNQP